MERINKIEDLQIGDIITVGKWLTISCRSWLGDLMTVKVIDAPYIAVDVEEHEHYTKDESDWKAHSMLFSEYEFLRPSQEYIDAIHEAKRLYREKNEQKKAEAA